MYNNRTAIVSILDDLEYSFDLARQFVHSSLEFTYTNNQYVHLNQEEQQRLLSLYQSYLQGMKAILKSSPSFQTFEADFFTLMKDHFKDLSSSISRFFDRETGWKEKENIILKQVVCSEYSPEFQLDLLGLTLDSMVQPVLDLGCRKKGPLVSYLRDKGISAIGVDRIVEKVQGLREVDWFDLDFIPESWGTVIFHMAFSNHFAFHHRYKKGKPTQYARLYMQIIQSLKPGGSFVYSPGLPFIERNLPAEKFDVQNRIVYLPEGIAPFEGHIQEEQIGVVTVKKYQETSKSHGLTKRFFAPPENMN
jgi:SAM-dependent methyltransferase